MKIQEKYEKKAKSILKRKIPKANLIKVQTNKVSNSPRKYVSQIQVLIKNHELFAKKEGHSLSESIDKCSSAIFKQFGYRKKLAKVI